MVRPRKGKTHDQRHTVLQVTGIIRQPARLWSPSGLQRDGLRFDSVDPRYDQAYRWKEGLQKHRKGRKCRTSALDPWPRDPPGVFSRFYREKQHASQPRRLTFARPHHGIPGQSRQLPQDACRRQRPAGALARCEPVVRQPRTGTGKPDHLPRLDGRHRIFRHRHPRDRGRPAAGRRSRRRNLHRHNARNLARFRRFSAWRVPATGPSLAIRAGS